MARYHTPSTGNKDKWLITAAWCSEHCLSYPLWAESSRYVLKWGVGPDLIPYTSCISTINKLPCLEQEAPRALHFYSTQSTQKHLHFAVFQHGEWEILQHLKVHFFAELNMKINTITSKTPLVFILTLTQNSVSKCQFHDIFHSEYFLDRCLWWHQPSQQKLTWQSQSLWVGALMILAHGKAWDCLDFFPSNRW